MAVHLGFLCPAEDLRADIHDFPSKVGGRPIWLNPNPLPAEEATCGVCGSPEVLLLQIYTPEEDPPEAYHRVVYIFCCKNGKCHKLDWKLSMSVFRSQLPKDNTYYRASEPDGDDDAMETDDLLEADLPAYRTCRVCGLAGNKSCGACMASHYCSKDHQTAHWSKGGHKQMCNIPLPPEADVQREQKFLRSCVFLEHELVSEDEPEAHLETDSDALPTSMTETMEGIKLGDEELVFPDDEIAEDSEVDVDKAFLKFQKRISREPEQVLRYARVSYEPEGSDPQPLWASNEGKPNEATDIGPCAACGGRRTFELQVMPQLLNSLGIVHSDPDAIDWGTLLVYSCIANCSSADKFYHKEAIWRQMFAEKGMRLRLPEDPK